MSVAQPARSPTCSAAARGRSARARRPVAARCCSGAGSRLAQPASKRGEQHRSEPRIRTCQQAGVTTAGDRVPKRRHVRPSHREDKDPSMDDSLLDRLKRFDDARPSLPAEHWLTFGAGIWLLDAPIVVPAGRLLSVATGLALVYRAASGRDGLVAIVEQERAVPAPGAVRPAGTSTAWNPTASGSACRRSRSRWAHRADAVVGRGAAVSGTARNVRRSKSLASESSGSSP